MFPLLIMYWRSNWKYIHRSKFGGVSPVYYWRQTIRFLRCSGAVHLIHHFQSCVLVTKEFNKYSSDVIVLHKPPTTSYFTGNYYYSPSSFSSTLPRSVLTPLSFSLLIFSLYVSHSLVILWSSLQWMVSYLFLWRQEVRNLISLLGCFQISQMKSK